MIYYIGYFHRIVWIDILVGYFKEVGKMSTVMKRLTRRENVCLRSFICVAMIVIVIAAGLFSTGMITYAGEGVGSVAAADNVATPSGASRADDGYVYYYDSEGNRVNKSGWYSCSSSLKYLLDSSYRVVGKFERSGDVIKIYKGDGKSLNWQLYKNSWQSIDGGWYYVDGSGVCKTLYDVKNNKIYILSNNKFALAKWQMVTLNDGGLYLTNGSGSRISGAGWSTVSNSLEVYTDGAGKVSMKICVESGSYRLYKYDSSSKKWNLCKNLWQSTASYLYYFSETGIATKRYNTKTTELYVYSAKKNAYEKAVKTIDRLNTGNYYYYSSAGVRDTKQGWKSASSNVWYYVAANGQVTEKYEDNKGVKRLYNYDSVSKSWTLRKKTWRKVNNTKYYFDASGKAVLSYNSKTYKASSYSKKKWKTVKKAVKKISGVNYYFNSKGVRVRKPGKYSTSDGYIAYVNRKGVVYKKEYNLSVKRYYKIDVGHGKTKKVYGYYSLNAGKKLMNAVNQYRAENGLSKLTISKSLTDTAQTRAKEVSYRYSHYRPNGTLCKKSMYELDGENLACGFSDADSAIRAWKKSSGHDYNMLNPEYKTIGAAVFIALKNDKVGYKRYYVLTFGK